MWNSHESERRLRDGSRERSEAASSSPLRPNFPAGAPPETSPGLASSILGGGGAGDGTDGPPEPEPAIFRSPFPDFSFRVILTTLRERERM